MAIKIGAAGDIHTAENNIFFGNFNLAVQFWLPMTGNSDRFFSNIYADLDEGLEGEILNVGEITDGGLPLLSDFNLYFAEGVTYNWNFVPKDDFIAQTGLETNSLFGEDPLFVDPENDDFHVEDSSPALGLGFHNFEFGADVATVGLIPRTDPVPPVTIISVDDGASVTRDNTSAIVVLFCVYRSCYSCNGIAVFIYSKKSKKENLPDHFLDIQMEGALNGHEYRGVPRQPTSD
eukprot:TRINITY_DN3712_c0_g1_i2.p1 TRINITY_DN3712_c0_g1~~TRINITY_DN3712_c0_g1_i2.p1  ORF type:complete len:234 (-),score=50.46 TRINITY_DN3712_c0_g1_i2:123-824(-)